MWCGKHPFEWVVAGTLNPCLFNTAASTAVLGVAAAAIVRGVRQLRTYDALGASRTYLWAVPGSKGPQAVQTAAAAILAVLHFLVLIFFTNGVHPEPYLIASESALLVTWAGVAAATVAALRRGACLRLPVFSALAAAAYAFSAYSEIQFYAHGLGQSPMQRKVRLAGALLAAAAAIAYAVAERWKPAHAAHARDALTQALLEGAQGGPNGASVAEGADGDVEAGGSSGAAGKRRRSRSWISLLGISARYMWPSQFGLQVRAVMCVALILGMRLLNLAVPIAYKKVIDEFSKLTTLMHPSDPSTPSGGPVPFSEAFLPWVAVWLALYFLQGGGGGGLATGLLANIRSFLWIRIGQAAFRQISLDVFTHVMQMDHHFHLHRKTGELLRIMDRGTASIQTLLGTVLFQLGPAMLDVAIASVFLAVKLKAWIAIIVFTTLGAYIPLTIIITEWRGAFRRELNKRDNERGARATDALLNYETVKLFGNERLEARQYAAAIDSYQEIDYKLSASMNALNIAQSLVIFIGVAAGMSVCAAGVADGSLTVGDAVLFVTLMQQLYAPLNFMGSFYRMLQQAMMDMEGIFELLGTEPGVADAPAAAPLSLPPDGTYAVDFRDVSFAYADGAPVLKNVSFSAPAGGTLALVGATGSGKSSLLRLLLRFYDPTLGAVLIGGQDIRSVTQASLRAAIGVVPQDTVLFNDTIRYNISYGRPGASDAEIIAAAEGACIDATIRDRFPLGYDTIVGERGLRLSGGEKQRVAFARALLKNPPILVLDEATSALDSITERRIQETLAATRKGRTVVVVAHRLSTIKDADRIVVMEHGEVVEVGTHAELVEREGGVFAAMWARQVEAGGPSAAASRLDLSELVAEEEAGETEMKKESE